MIPSIIRLIDRRTRIFIACGKELIAHEMAHVVQQGSGSGGNSGSMMVNAPGDRFEQEADSVAGNFSNSSSTSANPVQTAPEDEEEDVSKQINRQEEDELEY